MVRPQGFGGWTEGGVVVIDVERGAVRLVRTSAAGDSRHGVDGALLQEQEILMGFLQITRGG